MTPAAPLGAGNPDPLDLDAAQQLEQNEEGRLTLVRVRAEKWIGAISAITGVLGTSLIIKGPTDATQLPVGWRITTGVALAAAIVLLATAVFHAYQAAYGDPNSLRQITAIPLDGLHNRLQNARRAAADDALKRLGHAIRAVFIAVALIATAVAITWFAPSHKTAATTTPLCLYIHGQLAARLQGVSIAATAAASGTNITACH